MIKICTVSMIGDHFNDKWTQQYPQPAFFTPLEITREEFDALRRDVEEMKALLKRAKIYDAEHGEPDCEMESKIALLKKMAELVGVDLEDII